MPSRAGSSAILCVTYRGSFIDGGVSSDSPPHRLLWQLYCLLVGHGWPHQVWLSERWCHLGHTRRRCRQCRHSLGQSTWMGCPCNPLCCAPQIDGPPNPQEVWWGCGSSGGGSLYLEKFMGGRPGGGGRYPDTPVAGVLGAVMPPEEAVTPHPGDSPTTWLHDGG